MANHSRCPQYGTGQYGQFAGTDQSASFTFQHATEMNLEPLTSLYQVATSPVVQRWEDGSSLFHTNQQQQQQPILPMAHCVTEQPASMGERYHGNLATQHDKQRCSFICIAIFALLIGICGIAAVVTNGHAWWDVSTAPTSATKALEGPPMIQYDLVPVFDSGALVKHQCKAQTTPGFEQRVNRVLLQWKHTHGTDVRTVLQRNKLTCDISPWASENTDLVSRVVVVVDIPRTTCVDVGCVCAQSTHGAEQWAQVLYDDERPLSAFFACSVTRDNSHVLPVVSIYMVVFDGNTTTISDSFHAHIDTIMFHRVTGCFLGST